MKKTFELYESELMESKKRFDQRDIFKERKIVKHTPTFTMKMKQDKVGLYVCQVVVQGTSLSLLIDTGAQCSVLFESTLSKVKVKEIDHTMEMGSFGGKREKAKSVVAKQVFFGTVEITNQPFIIIDDKHFRLPLIGINMMDFDGILGWDVLSHLDFELDDVNKTFSLITSTETFPIQNFIPAAFPTLIVMDSNQRASVFGFDSGARESWLGESYIEMSELGIITNIKPLSMGVHGMERVETKLVDYLQLYLYDTRMVFDKIITGPVNIIENLELSGVLGNRIFKGRKLQIYSSKRFMRIL
ncbi:hypothetical protein A4S06_11475 [Erysipelotrichaceae bacterium MTC7]|nr:hypothetical protein A4S06_11475 [Erysipelotrichaceae bacterium MTC7]